MNTIFVIDQLLLLSSEEIIYHAGVLKVALSATETLTFWSAPVKFGASVAAASKKGTQKAKFECHVVMRYQGSKCFKNAYWIYVSMLDFSSSYIAHIARLLDTALSYQHTSTCNLYMVYIIVELCDFHCTCNSLTFALQAVSLCHKTLGLMEVTALISRCLGCACVW